MSEIDSYRHECLGIVHCPASFPFVSGNANTREIWLYRLLQDVRPEADSFEGKSGDLLLGGGYGEAPALWIALPEAFELFTQEPRERRASLTDVCRAHWSANEAFVLCEGFSRLGWTPESPIELWLLEHILAFVIREYQVDYGRWTEYLPSLPDGSICRSPHADEFT